MVVTCIREWQIQASLLEGWKGMAGGWGKKNPPLPPMKVGRREIVYHSLLLDNNSAMGQKCSPGFISGTQGRRLSWKCYLSSPSCFWWCWMYHTSYEIHLPMFTGSLGLFDICLRLHAWWRITPEVLLNLLVIQTFIKILCWIRGWLFYPLCKLSYMWRCQESQLPELALVSTRRCNGMFQLTDIQWCVL